MSDLTRCLLDKVTARRTVEGLLRLAEGQELTNAMYQELFEVSRRTATRDLRTLLKTGWVRQKGTGKGTRYVAN